MLEPCTSSASYQADDAASLRAALSVFDDWDCDLTALFQLTKEVSYGRQHKQTKAADLTVPYKPRRDQRKQELAALRAQVDELETVVALEKALIKQPPPLLTESMEAAALRDEWERMATNQHEARLAAEVENAKLRELVESQMKHAEQIVKLTKRVTKLEQALPMEPEAMSFENFIGPKIDVQTHLRQIDAMLPRTSELFASGGFADETRGSFHEVHFVDTDKESSGVGVLFEASWLLPFEAEKVTDALWVHTVRPTFKHKKSAYMDIHEDGSSLVSQFISTPTTKDVWPSQGQIAARRMPRDLGDGSFLILVTIQARVYVGSTWKGCAAVDGWVRIDSVLCRDGPMTRVKWYRHTLLQPPHAEMMTQNELGNWINTVVCGPTRSKFERDLEWNLQALENMLVSPKPAT